MLEVAVDIGNTRIKAAVFEHSTIRSRHMWDNPEEFLHWIDSLSEDIPVVIGNVGQEIQLLQALERKPRVFFASATKKLPIQMRYETPDTLGIDRLAGVAAAWDRLREACVVFDLGSCMTIDVIDENGVYLGGNIAPGWNMRLRAMHEFTEALPIVTQKKVAPWGTSTTTALQSGAFEGVKYEIEGYIRNCKQRFPRINVMLTGGDAIEFAKYIKFEIFVVPDLIFEGLLKLMHANT